LLGSNLLFRGILELLGRWAKGWGDPSGKSGLIHNHIAANGCQYKQTAREAKATPHTVKLGLVQQRPIVARKRQTGEKGKLYVEKPVVGRDLV
jgi:hypothetical protein